MAKCDTPCISSGNPSGYSACIIIANASAAFGVPALDSRPAFDLDPFGVAAASCKMCVDGLNIGRGPSIEPVFTVNGFTFDPPLPLPLPALACESSPISTMLTPFGAENASPPLPFDTSISLELFCFMIPGMFTLITNGRARTSRPVPRRNRSRSRRLARGAYAPAGLPPAAAAAAAAARAARNCANRVVVPTAPSPRASVFVSPRSSRSSRRVASVASFSAPSFARVSLRAVFKSTVGATSPRSSIVLNDTRRGRDARRARASSTSASKRFSRVPASSPRAFASRGASGVDMKSDRRPTDGSNSNVARRRARAVGGARARGRVGDARRGVADRCATRDARRDGRRGVGGDDATRGAMGGEPTESRRTKRSRRGG